MELTDYIFVGVGIILQVVLVVRCSMLRMWSRHSFFFVFLVFNLLRTLSLPVMRQLGMPYYASVYWLSEFAIYALLYCVAFESYRRAFPHGSVARKVAGLAISLLLLLLAATFLFSERPGALVIPDVLRKAGAALASWLVLVLIVARYFRLRLGRDLLSIIVGTGILISISVINLSAYGLSGSFFSLARYIGPACVLGVYLFWMYTLWYYPPGVEPRVSEGVTVQQAQGNWQRAWQRLAQTLRKVLQQ